MPKRTKIANYILMALALLWLVYYDGHRTIVFKGITSAWFVVIGLINLICRWNTGHRKVLVLMEIGLFLTAAADVILWNHFMLGAGIFAVGHIFYFAAFSVMDPFRKQDWLPIGILAAVTLVFIFCTPFIQVQGVMAAVLVAYALIISCMLGKNVANLRRNPTLLRKLLFIGGIMFWFSDLMLALCLFGDGGRLANALCVYSYWPGQLLLAHSMLYTE